MASLQTVEGKVIRASLLTLPAVTAIVGENIFWNHVDDDVVRPYIVVSHTSGGYDQEFRKKAGDTIVKVVGVTDSMFTAIALADAISDLDGLVPVIPDDVCAAGCAISEQPPPFFERNTPQNNVIFTVGGYYRLILTIEGKTT